MARLLRDDAGHGLAQCQGFGAVNGCPEIEDALVTTDSRGRRQKT